VGGKVICVPVALPASTSANTPAEGNQRFHLRTESFWIPVTKPEKNPSDNADLGFQAVGPALRIMQLNVEGLSEAKRSHTQWVNRPKKAAFVKFYRNQG